MLNGANSAPPVMFLVYALTSEDADVRKGARDALLVHGTDVLSPLQQLLADPDPKVRSQAARILAESGSPEGADILATFLDDEQLEVRQRAEEGLISRGTAAVVPVLHELITHSASPRVRSGVVRILDYVVRFRHFDIVQPVLTALKEGAPAFDVPFTAYRVLDTILSRQATGEAGAPGSGAH